MNSEFHFSLDIDREDYLRYYSGDAKSVQVRANQGLIVEFPASALKSHVTYSGIQGNFVIKFDENNKLLALDKY
ncbi:MAG: hypothetical protein COA74_14670 [Gammaproteobacteria bacterium]|nr:MAG: hypothetical protein COA74_14670 [Gammaproteobacteria bacterium]